MEADMLKKAGQLFIFTLLVFSFFLSKLVELATGRRVKLKAWFNTSKAGSISQIDLIELSLQNLKAKKTRTMITIGGMTIGIAVIVFLVSLGYGIQQLVVTRVASLAEMQQADIIPPSGGKLKIDDSTLSSLKGISTVSMALPLISVVGRVSYQNSVSDVAVYGVTADYLKQSAIKPVEGKIFESNNLTMVVESGEVAGVSTENMTGADIKVGDQIGDIEYSLDPSVWMRVRERPDSKSKIMGYTRRMEGTATGIEVWGGNYISTEKVGATGTDSMGKTLDRWVAAKVPLWTLNQCDVSNIDCAEGKYQIKKDQDAIQVQDVGFIAEIGMKVNSVTVKESNVLGVSTDSANGSLPQVEIASESGKVETVATKTIPLSSNAKLQAVVNRALLNVLGIKENEAVGKDFSASFVVVGNLLADNGNKIESVPAQYSIVGVIPDDKTPMFYVPFIDLRSLGVTNYSQVKMVVTDANNLQKTRRQVEAMGYITRSVADTVAQINSLFGTARTVMAFLGFMALSVAALGMFNTLTVSLMERTREVGLMKAMGMKSSEIQELFLSESLIMGLCGGIFGLLLGFLMGKVLGLGLSLFSVYKGMGLIDVSYIPLSFILVIIVLSLIIGIVTGIYPARRATKISALNALRYE